MMTEQTDATILKEETYNERAKALFKEGYNCSQSVFLAFHETYDLDFKTALRISSSFGGGMGRLREVCGAVSGMFMTAGMLYGYEDPKDHGSKTAHYARIQELVQHSQINSTDNLPKLPYAPFKKPQRSTTAPAFFEVHL